MKKELFDFINEKYLKQKEHIIFEDFLKPELVDIDEGYAVISMKIEEEHLNLIRIVHGGILASIADLTMGIACISYKKKVVTTEMSLSYIRSVERGSTITAKAIVENNGKSLMRTSCAIYDENNRLLLKSMGTFFVTNS